MSDERITRLHDDGLPPDVAARLDARLAGLPTGIEPPTGTFEAIAARLPERHRRGAATGRTGSWGGFALAASVAALAVVVALDGGAPAVKPNGAPAPSLAATTATDAGDAPASTPRPASAAIFAACDRYRTASLPSALGGRAAFGEGFLQVREALSTDFAARLERLDPATREVVEANLQVIHGALTRIEGVLAGNPDDAALQELLMSTYRQELDYMERVGRMPAGPEGSMEL